MEKENYIEQAELIRADNDGMIDRRITSETLMVKNEPLVVLDQYDYVSLDTAAGEGMTGGK